LSRPKPTRVAVPIEEEKKKAVGHMSKELWFDS